MIAEAMVDGVPVWVRRDESGNAFAVDSGEAVPTASRMVRTITDESTEDSNTMMAFRAPTPLAKEVKHLARSRRMSVSALIRQLLAAEVERATVAKGPPWKVVDYDGGQWHPRWIW